MKRRKLLYRKNYKPFLIIILCLSIILYAFIFVDHQIRPTVEALSEVQARIIGTQSINDGVNEVISSGIQYDDLVNIMKDEEGNITLIQANTIEINKISADITDTIQEKMAVVTKRKLKIPLGNIIGSQVLSSYGPKLSVEITPAGSVIVDFYTEFQEAGINQTIHRIYIQVETKVQIIAPLSSKAVDIVSSVPIAETVIVGKVPESYINVPDLENKDFLDVIPKK
ncbi:sporulation protein YunB [Garciella nitratireducens]|uniref:Sporulation protein YunB n=1 Tax=Garciella nitratireducens DSM 15102 TaxID=1121911 RepID=A0A1T4K228_9FIRM|nr:sporulation protein YunB [Garciella nitratireducens]RBP46622.1 sporulation protein YunB [Garciella nitratireducens]SJZ36428.1 sporulation protein YunB [Garciella nitratireducens DSM 15102]